MQKEELDKMVEKFDDNVEVIIPIDSTNIESFVRDIVLKMVENGDLEEK